MPVANSVTVTESSAVVTGYLTSFVGAEGDLFSLAGLAVPIASVDSTTRITLAYAWPGATVADQTDFQILKTGDFWNDNVTTLAKVNELLEKIKLGLPLSPDYAGTIADRAQFDLVVPPFLFLAASPTPARLYVKNGPTAADWSVGIAISSDPTQAAVDAAAEAQTYSTAAQNSADAAAASSTAAAGHAADAEASAGSAAAAGLVYPDTAAGIAATADGGYFYVPSAAPSNTFLTLYRRSGSSATAINEVPSRSGLEAALEPLPFVAPLGYAASVIDDSDRAPWGIKEDGTSVFAAIETAEFTSPSVLSEEIGTEDIQLVSIGLDSFSLAFLDEFEQVSGGLRPDGSFRMVDAAFDTASIGGLQTDSINNVPIATILAGGASAPAPAVPDFKADVIGLIGYGQSLAQGVSAVPVVSGTARFPNHALRFTSGIRPGESSGSGLTGAFEQVQPTASNVGETPVTGSLECVIERIGAENFLTTNDFKHAFFGAAAGVSSTTVAQLSKGNSGGGYTGLINTASGAKTESNAVGRTFAVGATTWTQGTSDMLAGTSQSTYQTALNQLVNDQDADIRAVTGQTQPVLMICGQSADHVFAGNGGSPTCALAQLALSKTNPLFKVACPMYQFPTADQPHLTAASSKWLGAFYGLTYKRIILDGKTDWAPLDCIAAVGQLRTILLTFHVPVGKLVWDTTQVPTYPNYGFQVVNSANSQYTLAGLPEIVGPRTVRLQTTIDLQANSKVRYGWGLIGSPPTIAGGNLRDQQGDSIVFNPTGINKRMDNFCVIFERSL